MSKIGQVTCLAERVEIGERWASGQNDAEIAQWMERPLATIRKGDGAISAKVVRG